LRGVHHQGPFSQRYPAQAAGGDVKLIALQNEGPQVHVSWRDTALPILIFVGGSLVLEYQTET
jgi:hypothetical protein